MEQKIELERKRPPTIEDELRLSRLHAGAGRSATRRVGERTNEVLRKQIADTKESIGRLRHKLTASEAGPTTFLRQRTRIVPNGIDIRSATKVMSATITGLETLIHAAKQHVPTDRKGIEVQDKVGDAGRTGLNPT
jgi:hypothetical protein